MKKKSGLTLEEHLEIAKELSIVSHHLGKLFHKLQDHYRITSRLMKIFRKITPGNLNGLFIQIQSELDNDWHKLINDDEFKKYGHIYYNLENKYSQVSEESRLTL